MNDPSTPAEHVGTTGLKLSFPEELPITAHVEEIRDLLGQHQVLVVAGETGSGKTTQLPKICLAAGLGARGMIAHTQPRRLAARAVATRIAEEMGVPLGQEVGYAVRFNDVVSEATRVKLVTDGLLLTEIRRDKLLRRYDCIIVDEAHERSLNVDFLLGYLTGVLKRRPELKLIITSATIDVAAFARHFGNAPIVQVGGRTYPVTVRYLDDADAIDDFDTQLVRVIEEIETGPQSRARDILVFLPGEREILETARLLRQAFADRLEVLPLYARLSAADQQRVFQPSGRRRAVLATNVAETSLTVPNIGYVVDQGLARISRYSFRSKLQRLPVEGISRASADQRAGRCGRVAPGTCFRLYSEADYLSRPEYTDPEIKRTNLASVVLQMRAFDLGDPRRFPFLEPPDPRAIRDAEKVLVELGALAAGRLTETGRVMARLPIDPRLARMLVAADRTRALSELLVITSAMAVSDPRERPVDKPGSADQAHAQWVDQRSDFLTYVNLWRWFGQQRENLTRAALRRTLVRQFLSNNRMREWLAVHRQLLLSVRELGMKTNAEPADYTSVHRALLAGSLSLIGTHDERGDYLGPRNLRFRIFPGSALADRRPKWIVAAEIVETRRVYARTVAQVEARWIEEAAPHLLKRRHRDAHWSLARGEALAYETVTLYGLVLSEKRPVSLAKLDRVEARNLFLLDALVRGALKQPPAFLTHNLELAAKIREEEDKGRRRDLLASEADIAARYETLVPQNVVTARELARWLRRAPAADSAALFFTKQQLTSDPTVRYAEEDFPSEIVMLGHGFAVRYRFAPGEPDDGVSIEVPMGLIDAVVPQALDWSVPGMLPLVCEQWLRSLPKSKRRQITPIADAVGVILPVLLQPGVYRQGRFDVSLARTIEHEFGLKIAADDWHPDRLPPNVRVNVKVLDPDGKLLDQDRDAQALKVRFAAAVAERMRGGLKEEHEESGLIDFPGQPLAGSVVLGAAGQEVVAYPALADEGSTVAVRHLTDVRQQAPTNRGGYARLALLKLGQTARYLKKQIDADKQLALLFAPLGGADRFRDELLKATAWTCFFHGLPLPEDAVAFTERLRTKRGALADVLARLQQTLARILEARMALLRDLDEAASPAFAEAVADVRAQMDALVPPDVLTVTPPDRLGDIPRYLEAARYRLGNLQGKVARDSEQIGLLAAFRQRIERLEEVLGAESDAWLDLRYGLEEVRVGLFAERLGVRGKASPKRLDRDLAALEREHGLI
ncbi:MAG TPA: ATP-dependent RNA helicase HrpA [Pseudomonadales bacterium]